MASILILYGTTEGHTAKVAQHLADLARRAGHDPRVVLAGSFGADLDIAEHDAFMVGASVHEGRHQRGVRDWIREHRAELDDVPSAFFQICLASAGGDDEGAQEAQGYADALQEETGWTPRSVGLFGGALLYTQYAWWKRALMRGIQARTGGPTDTGRDHEFTEWPKVDAWARAFFATLEAPTAKTAAPPPDAARAPGP